MTTLRQVLQKAQKGGYAVGAFNTSNLEITQGIVSGAVKANSPVIIATSPKALAYAGSAAVLANISREVTRGVRIPTVLHLDHAKTKSEVEECIKAGYTSVMFDGSRLPYKDNIRITKQVVRYAHARGVSVEAELGIIGGKEDYLKKRNVVLADPDTALDFVKKTGIDALAAAVGTAHGLAADAPEKIDFDLLRAIRAKVKVPLVLHGASQGISDAHIRKAISCGIAKINIDTDLRVAFAAEIRRLLGTDKKIYDPRAIIEAGRAGVERTVIKKIMLFSSNNRSKV